MKYALVLSLCLVSLAVCEAEPVATDKPADIKQEPRLTEEQQRIADAERESKLKEMSDNVKEAERSVKAVQKSRDKTQIQKAKDELAFARKQLNTYKKRTDQEWLDAAQIRKSNEHLAATNAAETKKNRPLSIEALGLHSNVINLPELVVVSKNNTDKPIEAYTVNAECFNKFDEPVKDIAGNNVYRGISQTTIQAGQKDKGFWQMSLHRNTAYARVWITRVRFADGTEWQQTKQEAMDRGQAFFRVELD
jgi:hypothetical protein